MIIDLLNNDGLKPHKVAMTNGGEYSSPCPACGGNDRFRSWPELERYWCRQCGKTGDAIKYLRDFHDLSFKEAANQLGKIMPEWKHRSTSARSRVTPARKKPKPPVADWTDMAYRLVEQAHKNLIDDPIKLAWLKDERGLGLDTVKRHQLGWVINNIFNRRTRWGLDEQLNENGNPKKVFIPSGLVIPCQDRGKIVRVRIRRDNPGDYGRYHVLPGSSSMPMVINQIKPWPGADPVIVVESELDTILLRQEIRNPSTFIALGSAQIKPSVELAEILSSVPFILVALDSDEAGGKQAVSYWLKTFKNAIRTPIPQQYGKDPTEGFLNGLNLNLWLSAAYKLVIDMADNKYGGANGRC